MTHQVKRDWQWWSACAAGLMPAAAASLAIIWVGGAWAGEAVAALLMAASIATIALTRTLVGSRADAASPAQPQPIQAIDATVSDQPAATIDAEPASLGATISVNQLMERLEQVDAEQGAHLATASTQLADVARTIKRCREAIRAAQEATGMTPHQLLSARQAAREVTDVVATIESIIEHTNLLALNAAIDASRAGRGVGVVASEIRTLATEMSRTNTRLQTSLQQMHELIARAEDGRATIASGLALAQAETQSAEVALRECLPPRSASAARAAQEALAAMTQECAPTRHEA